MKAIVRQCEDFYEVRIYGSDGLCDIYVIDELIMNLKKEVTSENLRFTLEEGDQWESQMGEGWDFNRQRK